MQESFKLDHCSSLCSLDDLPLYFKDKTVIYCLEFYKMALDYDKPKVNVVNVTDTMLFKKTKNEINVSYNIASDDIYIVGIV